VTSARSRFGVTLLLVLGMATSCTAAVRSSNTPAPFETGFVTNGNDVTRNVYVGDVAHVCSQMSGGAASMAGPLLVYPRATQTFAGEDVPNGYARILESNDSWQMIARWYRHAMPAGSERKTKPGCQDLLPKNMPPPEVASFSVGKLGKDYRAVFIAGLPANETPHGWPKGKKVPRTIIMIRDR
jgi:hypothetical protein